MILEVGRWALDQALADHKAWAEQGLRPPRIAVNVSPLQLRCRIHGTGYSSLRYLAKLPVHALKIDRSFIVTMTADADSMALVSSIISLAHSLGLLVVAEGVDSDEQAKFLRLMKCDVMQGYLFGRPQPATDVARLLAGQADGEGT